MKGAITAGVALLLMAPPQQIFRVGVDAVAVDVLVTNGHEPIGGLTASDFELRDSGVLQRIDSVLFEDVPLSMMLVLDASSSMDRLSLRNLQQAGSAVVGLLRAGDRGSVLTFSEAAHFSSEWTSDHQELARAIEGVRASGTTALHDAAYAALTLRDPQPGRRLILMFSDGDDTGSSLSGQTVIEIARRSDAVAYTVGLRNVTGKRLGYLVDFRSGVQRDARGVGSSELTKSFLAALAEETGGKYLDAERSERLNETFVRIVTEFRSRYLLTYIPTGVETGGWHPIDVTLKKNKGRVRARRGYLR
jgi:Ca-activated chloride channel family protein